VQSELAVAAGIKVTARAVVRDILFKEMYLVAQAVQRADDCAIRRGVPVAPRGGKRQAKYDNFHSSKVLRVPGEKARVMVRCPSGQSCCKVVSGCTLGELALHCGRNFDGREKPARATRRDSAGGPGHAEDRPVQLLPQLRDADARLTLQNGVHDLRLLPD